MSSTNPFTHRNCFTVAQSAGPAIFQVLAGWKARRNSKRVRSPDSLFRPSAFLPRTASPGLFNCSFTVPSKFPSPTIGLLGNRLTFVACTRDDLISLCICALSGIRGCFKNAPSIFQDDCAKLGVTLALLNECKNSAEDSWRGPRRTILANLTSVPVRGRLSVVCCRAAAKPHQNVHREVNHPARRSLPKLKPDR